MPRCAFLTLESRGDFVIDDECAIPALEARGWSVELLPWRTPDADWAAFDAIVVRSTWDWFEAPDAFRSVLRAIDRATRLANPLPLLEWNLSKTYLRALDAAGVAIVPSLWFEGWTPAVAQAAADRFGDDWVVKPVFGANGDDAFRVRGAPDEDLAARLQGRLGGRPCLVQPFRGAVLDEGEYSAFWLGGAPSHAIRKCPAGGEFRSQEERGARILPVPLSAELEAAARRAVAALQQAPLYARVDFVRGPDGTLELMELELVEPSLYLRTDPLAPERFAIAVDAWFR